MRASHSRGFTLMELMVAGAIGVIVLSAATLFAVGIATQVNRQRQLALLRRNVALVLEQLSGELRQAGLGTPGGLRASPPYEAFPGPILEANPQSLVFMADVPRPTSNLNGIALISGHQSPGASSLLLLDELNNGCDPALTNAACLTNLASLSLEPIQVDCGSSPAAPSCPWGLGKFQPGEWLIVTDGNGAWNEVQVETFNLDSTAGNLRSLALSGPMPAGFPAMPPQSPNVGVVSSPDRILYRAYAGGLWRDQCWGTVGSPVAASILSVPCSAGPDGTGWEGIATGVSALQFSYLDGQGNLLQTPLSGSGLAMVATVRIQLTLTSAGGRSESASLDVTPRNRGGG